jgi:hypothetical protein
MLQISPQLQALLSKPHTFAHLLTIDLATPLYLTDDTTNIEYNGQTYLAGIWQSAPDIETKAAPKIENQTFAFNAADNSIFSLFESNAMVHRAVTFSRLYFDQHNQPLEAVTLWRGWTSAKSIATTPKKSTLTLTAASIWSNFGATAGRFTNDKSNRRHFPDDAGFEFCGQLITDLPWGKEGEKTAQRGSYSGRNNRNSRYEAP